jgi:penicillin-binding protein 1A
MTLKYAFAKSVNSIAAKLTKEIGWGKVIEFAHKMGIKSKLENVPSVSLGSSDVTLYELLCGYATCVNGGLSIEPILVASVIDREGKVVGEFKPKFKRALSQETAFMVQQLLLAGLTEPGGTTSNLFTYNLFKHNTDIGGKTGTSQNHSDGWFVGVTPRLIGGSWVGWEDRAVHFRTSQLGEAARTSLPIFGRFLERVINDDRYASIRGRFPKPDFPITKHYQCRTPYIRKDTTEIDDLEPEPDILE